jgi:hypothetical protein
MIDTEQLRLVGRPGCELVDRSVANNPGLRQAVVRKLRLNRWPEQMAGQLKKAHPEDGFYHVSHKPKPHAAIRDLERSRKATALAQRATYFGKATRRFQNYLNIRAGLVSVNLDFWVSVVGGCPLPFRERKEPFSRSQSDS